MTKIDEILSVISKPRAVAHDEPVSQRDWSDVVSSIAKLVEVAKELKDWGCPPIGSKYTRYPRVTTTIDGVEKVLEADPEPAARWPGTAWEEITLFYAGCFFRAEGGAAKPFNAGRQLGEIQQHRHRYGHHGEKAKGFNSGGFLSGGTSVSENSHWRDDETSSVGDEETRPVNHSIKIYQRLA